MRLAGIYHSRDGIWTQPGRRQRRLRRRGALLSARRLSPGSRPKRTRSPFSAHHARARDEAQPQKMAGALANNPPLRINDIAPIRRATSTGSIRRKPSGHSGQHRRFRSSHQRLARRLGRRLAARRPRTSTAATSRSSTTSATATLTSITLVRQDACAGTRRRTPATATSVGGVNHDVLIIDMDQEYKQCTQELRLASNDDAAKLPLDRRPLLLPGGCEPRAGHPLRRQRLPRRASFRRRHHAAEPVRRHPESVWQHGVVQHRGPGGSQLLGLRSDRLRVRPSKRRSRSACATRTTTRAIRRTTPARSTRPVATRATYYDEALVRQLAAGLPACVPKTNPAYIPFVRCANVNTSREDLDTDQVGGKVGAAVSRDAPTSCSTAATRAASSPASSTSSSCTPTTRRSRSVRSIRKSSTCSRSASSRR